MSAQLEMISPAAHKDVRIDMQKAEAHGAELNLIPVVLAEFAQLVVQYPIVLTKHGESGQFMVSAMTGFNAGENLFWQNEQWQGVYTPLQVQRQPFFVGQDEASGGEQYAVCLNKQSPAINDSEGERIYLEDGSETEFFNQVKGRLAALLQGEQLTQDFVSTLLKHDLVEPLLLEITFKNGEQSKVSGLYTIHKEKLAGLSAEVVAQLHQSGYLEAIYNMTASMGQIYSLIERKNQTL